MTEKELADSRKKRHEAIQALIRVAIECMEDEKKGRLITRGVIAILQDTINYLESSALHTDPKNYLDKPEL